MISPGPGPGDRGRGQAVGAESLVSALAQALDLSKAGFRGETYQKWVSGRKTYQKQVLPLARDSAFDRFSFPKPAFDRFSPRNLVLIGPGPGPGNRGRGQAVGTESLVSALLWLWLKPWSYQKQVPEGKPIKSRFQAKNISKAGSGAGSGPCF